MYIQPTSEDMGGIQLPRDYSGTAFGNDEPPVPPPQEEIAASEATAAHEPTSEDATPAFAPTQAKEACVAKSRGGIFSFLSGNPLLSSLLPPPSFLGALRKSLAQESSS